MFEEGLMSTSMGMQGAYELGFCLVIKLARVDSAWGFCEK